MLPDASSSQDRIFATQNAVIVLDGASAFVPVKVSPSTYVDTLGRLLVEGLASESEGQLIDLLAQAIEESVSLLDLRRGASPSSTVAIARKAANGLDLLVLGDSQIAMPQGVYVDDRIAHVAQDQRAAYRTRLATGDGFDETHRKLLKELQLEQSRHRNTDEGYWIAEADPAAARHAVTARVDVGPVPWLVLATDGAYRPMRHLGLDDWPEIAHKRGDDLLGLLTVLNRWEEHGDPLGLELPRAKRHDDKAIANVALGDWAHSLAAESSEGLSARTK